MRAFRDLRATDQGLKADAIEFLTAATPEYAESLETWCAFAMLDPNRVITRTREYLVKGALIAV